MASPPNTHIPESIDSEWCSAELNVHVDIPHSENAPHSQHAPSTADPDASLIPERLPDLRGRTRKEVQYEASKIRMGQYFCSFEDFDRCLHSWAVLNGRGAAKAKTNAKYCLRICRFHNPSTCTPTEKPNPPDFTWCQEEVHCTPIPSSQSSYPTEKLGAVTNVRRSGKENFIPSTVVGGNRLHVPLQKSVLSELSGNRLHSGNSPAPCKSSVIHSECQREPLKKSFVHHTRVWLPNSFKQNSSSSDVHSVQGPPKIRKVSETGACGQLSRFLPVDPSSTLPTLPCPFRVRCQKQQNTGQCRITVCNLVHTCPQHKHKWRGPNQKAKWLGVTLAPRIVRNVQVPIAELLAGFKQDYKKSTTYKQMLRGKDLVRDWYLGGQRLSFHKIPALMQRIKEVDPEAIVDWSCQEGTPIFQRAFVCPSATQNALLYCQPMVSLDACHSKNRKYPCQIFLATVLDGNSQVFILAYAVAPVENTDNWIWFLDLLDQSILKIERQHVPFVSDRQKGLMKAVREVFPGKIHAHCANHLRQNVKKWFGKAAEQFFVGCVYATSRQLYEELLDRLERSVTRGTAAAEYIRKIDPKLYARHAFPLPRFGKVTSNPCEQTNAGLLPLREYAPFKLLHELWFYMQKKFTDRGREAMCRSDRLTAQALRRLEKNQRSFGQWEVLYDGAESAKVQTTDHTREYLVMTEPHFWCTCQELQEMYWPCEHIMAWDDQDGRDYNVHFAGCWKTEMLQKMYLPSMPNFLTSDLCTTAACLPPPAAVKKGRHRVVRIQSGGRRGERLEDGSDEFVDSNGDVFVQYPLGDDPAMLDPMPSMSNADGVRRVVEEPATGRRTITSKKRSLKCSRCGNVGHNRRTCGTRQANFVANCIPQSDPLTSAEPDGTESEYVEDILSQPQRPEVPHYSDSSSDDTCEDGNLDAGNENQEYSSLGSLLFSDGDFESVEEVERILQLAEEGARNVTSQMQGNT